MTPAQVARARELTATLPRSAQEAIGLYCEARALLEAALAEIGGLHANLFAARDALITEGMARNKATADERAAIVAWLRKHGTASGGVMFELAAAIESGAHVQEFYGTRGQ